MKKIFNVLGAIIFLLLWFGIVDIMPNPEAFDSNSAEQTIISLNDNDVVPIIEIHE